MVRIGLADVVTFEQRLAGVERDGLYISGERGLQADGAASAKFLWSELAGSGSQMPICRRAQDAVSWEWRFGEVGSSRRWGQIHNAFVGQRQSLDFYSERNGETW